MSEAFDANRKSRFSVGVSRTARHSASGQGEIEERALAVGFEASCADLTCARQVLGCGTIARAALQRVVRCGARHRLILHLRTKRLRAMLELNLIYTQIKDMQGRLDALRGYL